MSERLPFDAIIFDFDGLILETEMPQYVAWREAFAEQGVDMPIDLWVRCLGRGTGAVDFIAHLQDATGRTYERESFSAAVREAALAAIDASEALPGVVQALDDAERIGLRIGLASGSSRRWVVRHLDRLGLTQRFEEIVTHEDTELHKPDPDPFLACAQRLALKPARCFVLEDSPNGVLSAKAAGMKVVAVPTEMTRPLDLSPADMMVDGLDRQPLEELMRRLART